MTPRTYIHVRSKLWILRAESEQESNNMETSETTVNSSNSPAALPPTSAANAPRILTATGSDTKKTTTTRSNNNNNTWEDDIVSSLPSSATTTTTKTTASMSIMISQENKRILIEELGYRRSDVRALKFDLAPAIVEQRITCPDGGMPESWRRSETELLDQETTTTMMKKVEEESRYPFKLPFLGISLIVFGKGSFDAFITIVKVYTSFPGASFSDVFMGIPVMIIDGACILVGAFLGWWTWNSMK